MLEKGRLGRTDFRSRQIHLTEWLHAPQLFWGSLSERVNLGGLALLMEDRIVN